MLLEVEVEKCFAEFSIPMLSISHSVQKLLLMTTEALTFGGNKAAQAFLNGAPQ